MLPAMALVCAITGGCGVLLAIFRGTMVDSSLLSAYDRMQQLGRLWKDSPPAADDELRLLARLIASLQAGLSLDTALEEAAGQAARNSEIRKKLDGILHGRPGNDFLSSFLASALRTGVPVTASLRRMEQALRTKRRLALRAGAATSQCRAQAEVLSWLPWVLAVSLALLDGEWFLLATGKPASWFLWSAAVLLAGLGRRWIQSSLNAALAPQSESERLEEESTPDLLLRLLAETSQGVDVESACERALASIGDANLSARFADPQNPSDSLARLKSLINHAARTGAPLRDDLLAFLQDLQAEIEARWEERIQRLPVALLGPLFACFFPSSLLVIAALLFPLMQGGF
ncbi:MAG TPA: hypothetical protein VIH99_04030 [Bdellovibrionota bacterium]|jgi:hypothetical protein